MTTKTTTKKVELTKTIFDANNILVVNSHTCYANIILPENVSNYTAEKFLTKYRKVVSLAKEKNAKIKYQNKTFSKIKKLNKILPIVIKEHKDLFSKLSQKWKAKLDKGIFVPTRDDHELEELYSLYSNFDKNYHRNQPIGIFQEIDSTLNKMLNLLNKKADRSDLTLYL
tara:strand:+ start:3417 stop:3926 length:510 start_codon:yes stop_codon:yes gene_type:complete